MIKILKETLDKFLEENKLVDVNYKLEKPTNSAFGDFSTNLALIIAKQLNEKPFYCAQRIKMFFDNKFNFIDKIEIAGPGFLNFYLNNAHYMEIISEILTKKEDFGKQQSYSRVNLEFVSANPTGFLHIAHARGAALGDSLANILEFAGISTFREYYINDAGNQIDTLGESVFVRYLQLFGKKAELDSKNSYKGKDIIWAANLIKEQIGASWLDKKYEDIAEEVKNTAVSIMLKKIEKDLEMFGVHFDLYFSEKSLYANDGIWKKLKTLKGTYEKDGAIWLETTKFGDDKDRVIVKSDKKFTYFLPDIIYHNIKLTRNEGVEKLINIWGADHSGYVKRMQVALELNGFKDKLEVIIAQTVSLLKDGQEFKMSKRAGTSLSLEDFINQVGKDTARFYLVNRSANSKLDFELNMKLLKSNDNPVYLVQYAHARASQLLAKSKIDDFTNLNFENEKEKALINELSQFPLLIKQIAKNYKVHLLTKYIISLAKEFNSFYSNFRILNTPREKELVAIVKATKIVLKQALKLIGVSAPEKM